MPNLKQSPDQRMLRFFLRNYQVEVLLHTLASANAFDAVLRDQLIVRHFCRRENAHTVRAEGLEQCTILELADHAWPDRQSIKPLVEPRTY